MMFCLEIRNFILIDYFRLDIDTELTGIIGESGSGKSLIFKAIEWLTSLKKDKEVIGSFSNQCSVTLTDNTTNTVYRKCIDANKRYYTINEANVSMRQFIESIQSTISYIAQDSALALFKGYQLMEVLDDNNDDNQILIKQYQEVYDQYCHLKQLLKKSRDGILDDNLKTYYHELIQTIDTLPFDSDEEEKHYKQLDQKYQSIVKQKELYHQFNQYKSELESVLSKWKTFFPLYNEQQLSLLIHDISSLKHHSESLSINENDESIDIDKINKNLYIASSLKRKFKVSSITQLLALKQDAIDKLNYADNALADCDNALSKIENLKPKLERFAFQLHANRLFSLSKIESKLYPILNELGLTHFNLIVNKNSKEYFAYGNQEIRLSVSYNHLTYDIDQLSGGEKSRFLLAFYCALDKRQTSLCCFDEIDTGISGQNAKAMANYLHHLAIASPTLVISHNPLIIAACNHCYYVSKASNDVATVSHIKQLDNNGKIEAIAKLSSGCINQDSLNLATSLVADYE